MALQFLRRPFMMGNTPIDVLSRPYIRGQIRRDDVTRVFTGLVLPAELRLRVDGVDFTVPLTGMVISTIIADIDGVLGAAGEAQEEDGYLTIYSATSGVGASVTIRPGAGVVQDASFFLGFPREPDPLATVESGDHAWSPPRARLENNPLGSALVAGGEGLTAESVNRAMFLLARNTDILYQTVTHELARGMEISVDPTDAAWVARLILDGSGNVEQIDLSDLSPWASLIERIYVGNGYVNRLSTLTDIAQFFAVMRDDLVEMIVGGRTVRVAAVTHGQRMAASPTFLNETTPPAFPIADVVNWPANDGTNLLGVDCVKSAAAAIDEVITRTTIRVIGATFIADGVDVGDKATITGAGVNDPFNHNGDYKVEQVIDEEHLILAAWTPGDRGELNPGAGALGSITVTSGTLFADGVWLTFEPPVPAGEDFKVVVGAAATLANFPTDYLLRMTIRSFEEVDDLVQEVIRKMKGPLVDSTDDFTAWPFAHSIPGGSSYVGEQDVTQELLWRRNTLQGAYDGQGRAAGGGFMIEVNDRPPRWQVNSPRTPRAGTVLRTGTVAQFLTGNIFYVPGEAFILDDVGRYIVVSGTVPAGMEAKASFKIIDYLDSEMVIVSEEEYAPGQIPVGAVSDYAVIEDRFEDWPAASLNHVIEQGNPTGRWGQVYFEDMSPYSSYQPGHAFAGLRESPLHAGDGTTTLRYFAATFLTADDWVSVPYDVTNSGNIRFGVEPVTGEMRPGGYLRITHHQENSGWYRIVEADDNGATGRLRLQNLDGSAPVFSIVDPDGRAHLYFATELSHEVMDISPLGPVSGNRRIGKWFYEDGFDATDLVGVLGIGWRGSSAGIWAVLNDPTFASIGRMPDATVGPFANIVTYNPAYGYMASHFGYPTGTHYTHRGNWAMHLSASTWAMDPNKTGPFMGGFTEMLVQQGWDPGQVIISKDLGASPLPSGSLPPQFTELQSIAAQVLANENEMVQMQGGAQELAGAVYQRHAQEWYGFTDNPLRGGVYSEMSGGFRHALYPLAYKERRYYETAHTLDGAARLGDPGQISSFTGALYDVVAISPPDPTRSRSVDTSGFVQWDRGALEPVRRPLDSYIGCQVEISNSSLLGPDNNDGVYTIINVIDSPVIGTIGVLEVEVIGARTLVTEVPGGGASPPHVAILGSRWHYGYVDTASFMMFGTESWYQDAGTWVRRHITQCPVLGVVGGAVQLLLDDGDMHNGVFGGAFITPEPAWPTYGHDFHSPNSLLSFIDQPYGHGDGAIDYMISTPGSDWFAPEPFVNDGWAGFYNEAVAPLPLLANEHTPFEDKDIAASRCPDTNFWNSEWVWVYGTLNYTGTVLVRQNPYDAGAAQRARMEFEINSAGAPIAMVPENFYLLSRGQRVFHTGHFNVLCEIEASAVVTAGAVNEADITLRGELIDDAGTVLGNVSTVTIPIGNIPAKYRFRFIYDELREAPGTGFENISNVRVRIHMGGITSAGGAAFQMRFWEIAIQLDRMTNMHAGNLIIEGGFAAQSFRALSPIRDYDVVGPAEAQLYVPAGYAAEIPILGDGDYTDGFRLPIDPPGYAVFRKTHDGTTHFFLIEAEDLITFKKGPDSASVRFLTKWTDPSEFAEWEDVGGDPIDGGWHPPARLGFVIPVRPPHGARLLELDLQMSFMPVWEGDGGSTAQIWAQRHPFGTGDLLGCRVRLMRQHLFRDSDVAVRNPSDGGQRVGADFTYNGPELIPGVHEDVLVDHRDPWDPAVMEHQREGFYEVLYGAYINTLEPPNALLTSNVVGGTLLSNGDKWNIPVGAEQFARRKYFFQTEQGGGDVLTPDDYRNPDPRAWIADTRQFAYYVIIDAWGRGNLTAPEDIDPMPDPFGSPRWQLCSGLFTPYFPGYTLGIPPSARAYVLDPNPAGGVEDVDYYEPLRMSPVMKFRGLRLGYEWTRLRPG